MTDETKSKLDKLKANGEQLVQKHQVMVRRPFRVDGYMNMLNKYGTGQDNSEAYRYQLDNQLPDTVLTEQYETNGLFAKIIDIPAQEAVKKGFKLNIADSAIEEYIQEQISSVRFFSAVEEAIKWSRLYGGAIGVMIIDDGANDLALPVNWRKARRIEDIVIYEQAVVTPDYGSMYSGYGAYGEKLHSKFRMPEWYNVFSIYGSFRVHESRCLLFRNGRMPEKATNEEFRFWGIPEYNRIKRALRETITAHSDAVKLLERSVQAVYKMKNLAQLLQTEEGEEKAVRRLQVIDMARGLLNSIAIDNDGEDYDFKSTTITGVKEVIDSCCNMLSALTEIPQTKLFGRSPAGMNATGDSDMENYYSFIDKIRESMISDNLLTLIDGFICVGINTHQLKIKPKYKLEFEPLWTEKESDKAAVDSQNASTDLTKAQTEQMYIEMGVLDPSEVRKRLKQEGKFGVEDEELPQQDEPLAGLLDKLQKSDSANDQYQGATGVGVFVVKDGKVLVGNRDDTNEVGGPGGHIEEWEDAERAARRETEEEFGIELNDLTPIGLLDSLSPEYGRSFIFLSTDFNGTPHTNTQEMRNNRFTDLSGLQNEALYEPFKKGLDKLLAALHLTKFDEGWDESKCKRDNDGQFAKTQSSDSPKSETGKKKEQSSTSSISELSKKSSTNSLTSETPSDTIKNTETTTSNNEVKENPKQGTKLSEAECEKIDSDFRHKLETGEQSKKIIAKKQAVHIKGTEAYEKARAAGINKSYFSIDEEELQPLVDEFAGKGKIRRYGNYPNQIVEDVDCGKPVGISVSTRGEEAETNWITIHYSAKGVHIVPKFKGDYHGKKL